MPLASKKFNYPENGFKDVQIHMNALYFALVYHLGLYPLENEDQILKQIGKVEHPFSNESKGVHFKFKGKSKVYRMKNLPLNIICS